jgi:hypothetical protein
LTPRAKHVHDDGRGTLEPDADEIDFGITGSGRCRLVQCPARKELGQETNEIARAVIIDVKELEDKDPPIREHFEAHTHRRNEKGENRFFLGIIVGGKVEPAVARHKMDLFATLFDKGVLVLIVEEVPRGVCPIHDLDILVLV